jgi:hypothetical protein
MSAGAPATGTSGNPNGGSDGGPRGAPEISTGAGPAADVPPDAPSVAAAEVIPATPAATLAPPEAALVAQTMPAVDAAKFYEEGYRNVLRAIIAAELARSGPLRIDRLAQRVARLHGFQRTGREIQDRVAAAIPLACRRTEDSAGVFVWPSGADPAAWDRFPRRQGAEPPLDPAELPLEVLTVLARVCLAAQADQEAALQLMRDGCGLTRFREPSRLRCLEAIALV